MTVRINTRFLGHYLFFSAILYLARSYLGGPFVFLFYTLSLTPILSIMYLITAHLFVRYHQYFENEHPVKGEDVRYRLIVATESPLAIPRIKLKFKEIHPHVQKVTKDLTFFMPGNHVLTKNYVIRCPYRGIYTIGLESIIYKDFLGIFELERSIWHRTFYVYPRILPLKSIPMPYTSSVADRQSMLQDILKDTTLFNTIRNYRRNESLRHVYWKKFASTGKPYIREYSTSVEQSVSIFIDMRNGNLTGIDKLTAEDTTIEIMIALLNYFLEQGVSLQINIGSQQEINVTSKRDFDRIYRETINLSFTSMEGIAHHCPQSYNLQWNIVVTHILDELLLDISEQSQYGVITPIVLFNLAGSKNRETKEHLIEKLIERGAKIISVYDSSMLAEELEKHV